MTRMLLACRAEPGVRDQTVRWGRRRRERALKAVLPACSRLVNVVTSRCGKQLSRLKNLLKYGLHLSIVTPFGGHGYLSEQRVESDSRRTIQNHEVRFS